MCTIVCSERCVRPEERVLCVFTVLINNMVVYD
jgi:hypothetical protein